MKIKLNSTYMFCLRILIYWIIGVAAVSCSSDMEDIDMEDVDIELGTISFELNGVYVEFYDCYGEFEEDQNDGVFTYSFVGISPDIGTALALIISLPSIDLFKTQTSYHVEGLDISDVGLGIKWWSATEHICAFSISTDGYAKLGFDRVDVQIDGVSKGSFEGDLYDEDTNDLYQIRNGQFNLRTM